MFADSVRRGLNRRRGGNPVAASIVLIGELTGGVTAET